MPTNRKLAAILFADISGYTSLMQTDESLALEKLAKFKSIVDQTTPQFGGKIVQYYGDGCLIIFESAIQSVRCAAEMQLALQREPHVPVRMGIHQGDILLEGDNIYGNPVNIAARIESMSDAGSVLMSSKITQELTNQSDLVVTSLGYFEFKNVRDAIEVFAFSQDGFIVPRRETVQGKFKEQSQEKSIAVLAFENRSSDPEQEYFAEGIAEEIMYGLSKLNNLKVAGRSSAFSFKNTGLDPREIAKQLKVGFLLAGSVRKMGQKLRITVQLVNGKDGFQIWTERYAMNMEDVFAIQDEIAAQVVGKMELLLLGTEKAQPIVGRKTESVEAYQLYLLGKSYLDQRMNIVAAQQCFAKAVTNDPKFASAYNGIAYAHVYSIILQNVRPHDGFPQAKEAVQRALALESDNAEAHTLRSWIKFYYDRDFNGAMQGFERAASLAPNRSDTYRIWGYMQLMSSQFDAAVKSMSKAYALDPMSFNNRASLGEVYFHTQHYEQAEKVLVKLAQEYPEKILTKELLGRLFVAQGRMEEADKVYQTISHHLDIANLYSFHKYLFYLQRGNVELYRRYLENLEERNKNTWIKPTLLSMLHFYLGDIENAQRYFEKACNDKDPTLLQLYHDKALREYTSQSDVMSYMDNISFPNRNRKAIS